MRRMLLIPIFILLSILGTTWNATNQATLSSNSVQTTHIVYSKFVTSPGTLDSTALFTERGSLSTILQIRSSGRKETPKPVTILQPVSSTPPTTTTVTTLPTLSVSSVTPTTTPTTTSATTLPPSAPPVLAPAETVSPPVGSTGWTYDQAEKVAVCEEGGFGARPAAGPTYYGWLGINAHNWAAYGCGTDYYSVQANIDCASKIQADPPDQNGCSGGW